MTTRPASSMYDHSIFYATSFPVSARDTDAHWTDTIVTQGHVDYCAAHGHASWEHDGVVVPRCPRCGVSTDAPYVAEDAEHAELYAAIALVRDDMAASWDYGTDAECMAHARNTLTLPGVTSVIGGYPLHDDGTPVFRAYVAVLSASEDAIAAAIAWNVE